MKYIPYRCGWRWNDFFIRIEFDEKAEMKSKPTWVIFKKCTRIDLNTIYGVWYNKIISRVSFKTSMATDVIFHVLPLSIFTCIPPLVRTMVKFRKTRTIFPTRSQNCAIAYRSTAGPRCELRKFKKKVKFNRPLWNWISKAEKVYVYEKCKRYSFLRCTNYLY